ncbi:S-adenosyl-L-methionine-dependent methyltransferase [Baffinella frigidus]|nr:S-adenosyl-L-methionine-dependent methyltransferase [Cryptophyta sp. CCMP2293]|mmetsp:Transcript_10390/g.23196  ORF Transcript_10390/g.23196 Transcript_10390/m.23196 type:complete len:307 (+) Transcript_10390:39-959(+)|eukprot:CAMPEP_0180138406 /NCGR_PEP_ID=MMETSP0986-20121125/12863_1 /TAXON_ID=697907 /ORGANISM="non described non described, Strain CCMP2293" /LENGTH=306 /DNA_ID=CAMNT_0022080201 /DNA_START=43 /DNA_END=963 /DNA_ORIENTATION=+
MTNSNTNTLAAAAAAGAVAGALAMLVLRRGKGGGAGDVRSTTASGSTVYESARAVDEYLQFHFAKPDELAPLVGKFVAKEALNFPALCAKECSVVKEKTRALDIGCAVGGSVFELARDFKEVVGFDFSSAFVTAAKKMQKDGSSPYRATVEADLTIDRVAHVPGGIDRTRCRFIEGDACNMLALNLGTFDAVLASNLMCRVPDPFKFLRDVHVLVKPGGVFVLISPYSWLKEYTDKSKWVGGYKKEGRDISSKEEVTRLLSAGFELVTDKDMPFLIREHQRKYQIGCSNCLVWRRKGASSTDRVVA